MKDLIKPGLFLFAIFLLIFTVGCGKTAVNHTNLPEGIETTSPSTAPATPISTQVPATAAPSEEFPPPGTFRVLFYDPLILTYDVDQ